MAYLIPIDPKADSSRIELVGETCIGRSPENDVVIDEESASSHHARIIIDAGGGNLIDLDSTNGTKVNGRLISEAVLVSGDTIQFGSVRYRFENNSRKRMAFPCKLLLVIAALACMLGLGYAFRSQGKNVAPGSLNTARSGHTATLLSNGKVLVVAGFRSEGRLLTSAEIYDPATGNWTVTGSLNIPRLASTATLLPNGKVLVAGGISGNDGQSELNSAEIYDPASGRWTVTGSLNTPRFGEKAILLRNGKVLVCGNKNAETYDPATENWAYTGRLNTPRVGHAATLLSDGKVLVCGGRDYELDSLTSAEIYDPTSGKWTNTGSPKSSGHTALLLPNRKVLGFGGGKNPSIELYDPVSGKWEAIGILRPGQMSNNATLLPSGKVLVFWGNNSGVVELFDPGSGKWTATGSLNTGRTSHTATLLSNGKVLVVGGEDSNDGYLTSAELYDPSTGKWRTRDQKTSSTSINPSQTGIAQQQRGLAEAQKGTVAADEFNKAYNSGGQEAIRAWYAKYAELNRADLESDKINSSRAYMRTLASIHDPATLNRITSNVPSSSPQDLENERTLLYNKAKEFGFNTRTDIESFLAPGRESLDNVEDVKRISGLLYKVSSIGDSAGVSKAEIASMLLDQKRTWGVKYPSIPTDGTTLLTRMYDSLLQTATMKRLRN